MRIHLNLRTLKSAIESNGITRSPTSTESQQIRRIVLALERGLSDENVSDVFVQNEISPRDAILLCSSACPEVIELVLLLLAYQKDWSINPEHETSLLIGVLALEPRLFVPLLEAKGWRYQSDTSDILKNIRIKYHWKRRPRAAQRRRGYSDKGSLPDEQKRLRNACLSQYYIEQFEELQRSDREIRDTLEILRGMLM